MYLAEIRGKLSRNNENKEDILTSNVFSFFKYADRKIFLYPFLKSLKLNISLEDASGAEFQFWPHYEDGTEPDLVIVAGKYYLLFEAKYFSGFSPETDRIEHQIVREIKGGRYEAQNRDKLFRAFAITAHYSFTPEIFRDVPPKYQDQIKWLNWQQIALLLYQIIEEYPEISSETNLFADDLYTLLLHKDLRTFAGTQVLASASKIKSSPESIFFDAATASYRGDFIGFLDSFNTVLKINPAAEAVFFNAASASHRGDFFGFKENFDQSGRIQSIGSVLFFKPTQAFFDSLHRKSIRVNKPPTILFFGGTNEKDRAD
jgi:hypothetical protein